jgi:hypothetical protein
MASKVALKCFEKYSTFGGFVVKKPIVNRVEEAILATLKKCPHDSYAFKAPKIVVQPSVLMTSSVLRRNFAVILLTQPGSVVSLQ